jgi:hypothetical protein
MRYDKECKQNFGSETSGKTFTWMAPISGWWDNIKTDLRDTEYEGGRWMEPSHNRFEWLASVISALIGLSGWFPEMINAATICKIFAFILYQGYHLK